ncbi:MAG: ABC transporter permease [Bacilli bacterium]|nr:ABC transporter permease [Bacilli bacterium]
MNIFEELYQYRELLKTNIHKEIRGKYKGSFLGIIWSFLNPLLMVLVYAIVFPYIMRMQQEHYLVYLITGIIPWNFFTTVVTSGCNCVWINGGIIKKVFFPREILPISVVGAALVNFLISCVIILLFVIFGGIGLSFNILWVIPIAIIQSMFSLGILFILSAINVYIRDIEYLVAFFMNLVFYATPIIYNSSLIPDRFRWILYLNPMTQFIDAYRNIFYYKTLPNCMSLFILFFVSIIVLTIGYLVFDKLEKGFAEEV